MANIKYKVPGISCGHCVHTIKSELGELEGVISVDADAATKEVVVNFEHPATEAAIEKLLTDINYPPQK